MQGFRRFETGALRDGYQIASVMITASNSYVSRLTSNRRPAVTSITSVLSRPAKATFTQISKAGTAVMVSIINPSPISNCCRRRRLEPTAMRSPNSLRRRFTRNQNVPITARKTLISRNILIAMSSFPHSYSSKSPDSSYVHRGNIAR